MRNKRLITAFIFVFLCGSLALRFGAEPANLNKWHDTQRIVDVHNCIDNGPYCELPRVSAPIPNVAISSIEQFFYNETKDIRGQYYFVREKIDNKSPPMIVSLVIDY